MIEIEANPLENLKELADQYPLYSRVGLDDGQLIVKCEKFGDIAFASQPTEPVYIPFVTWRKLTLETQTDEPYAEQYCEDYTRCPYGTSEGPFVRKVHEFQALVKLPGVLAYFVECV